MSTAFIVLFVFGILILIHEAGHLVAAKRVGIRVEVFSIGMGKRLFGVKVGDTDYRVSLFPFGGYCKMAGEERTESTGKEDEFMSKPAGHRFWVVSAGALTNYFFAFVLFSLIFMIGSPTLSNRIGDLLDGYPALKAGIMKEDEILSINDMTITYWDDVLSAIRKYSQKDNPLLIKVKRSGEIMTFSVTPDISEKINVFGQKITRPMLGIAPKNDILSVSYGPVEAFRRGAEEIISLTCMTYKMLWLVITGGVPVKNTLSGPIGIIYFIKEASTLGLVPLMIITAHISMALAIFNLLPVPVLDGGHLLFLGIEKVCRKPLSHRVQENITQVGLYLLIFLMVFVFYNDFMRFGIFEKISHMWRK